MKQNEIAELKVTKSNVLLWSGAFDVIAKHYAIPFSAGRVSRWIDAIELTEKDYLLPPLATKYGLQISASKPNASMVSSMRLPVILHFPEGDVGVLTSVSADKTASIIFSGDNGCVTTIALAVVLKHCDYVIIARPRRRLLDERIDGYVAPYKEHWFRSLALRDTRYYVSVLVASFVANILALASVMFSMQVYDRVVPSKSVTTLYVLFAGVLLAVIFEYALRRLRGKIIDYVGKRTDLFISDLTFGHALRVKNQVRPKSTGTFIAQLRDLEQIRELLTSTTVSAVADLPFFFLFLVIFWLIGGSLVLIPVVALILLLVPGLALQGRLKAAASLAQRESSLRNAMLVEAVQGVEDIKALQVEEYFQQKWNDHNAVSAQAHLKLRAITNGLTGWSTTVQTLTFVAVVVLGAPMVIAGDLTTGALVGCSILGSRMMAPMAQLSQVLGRYQQARVGLESINSILKLPTDHPEGEAKISLPVIRGNFVLSKATFQYGDREGTPALSIGNLGIAAGSKIGLLGRNGAGKSTLLMALAGMIEPKTGEVLLDNNIMSQLDPADLRQHFAIITQESRLFHGTIRENLMMGSRQAADEAILQALEISGAGDFVRKVPNGLDRLILEGGRGLSGGQKQALLLARVVLRDPSIILLDEPTAAMDEASEREFIKRFNEWAKDRTVVLATHRMRSLELVDRVLLLENGQIVRDGEKEDVLASLRGNIKRTTINAPSSTQTPKLAVNA